MNGGLQLGDNIYIQVTQADKDWGQGRFEQQLARRFCNVFGHAWLSWYWWWEEEEMTEMDFGPLTPPPLVTLHWFRGCDRGCGVIQSAHARYDQRDQLPS